MSSYSPELVYLHQLQGADYSSLAAARFKIGVVDCDDSRLTAEQVNDLQSSGKTLFSYLSVGEAENYRDYWQAGNWDDHPPAFLLGENREWEGNYRVAFWDETWQRLMVEKAVSIAQTGYSGIYLDIIDAYQHPQAIRAYSGTEAELRQEMIDFVIRLSQAVKAVDPGFKVITQNAVGLLALDEDLPSLPNAPYLNAIDGIGKEDTWTAGNAKAPWTQSDLEFLKIATGQGRFVLAIDYPTYEAAQLAFIEQAAAQGFIPFIGNRALDGAIDPTNYQIGQQLPAGLLAALEHSASLPPIAAAQPAAPVSPAVETFQPVHHTETAPPVYNPGKFAGDAILFSRGFHGMKAESLPSFFDSGSHHQAYEDFHPAYWLMAPDGTDL